MTVPIRWGRSIDGETKSNDPAWFTINRLEAGIVQSKKYVLTFKEKSTKHDTVKEAKNKAHEIWEESWEESYRQARQEAEGIKRHRVMGSSGPQIVWDNYYDSECCSLTGEFGKKKVAVSEVQDEVWSVYYEGHVWCVQNGNGFPSREEAIEGLVNWIEEKIVY